MTYNSNDCVLSINNLHSRVKTYVEIDVLTFVQYQIKMQNITRSGFLFLFTLIKKVRHFFRFDKKLWFF